MGSSRRWGGLVAALLLVSLASCSLLVGLDGLAGPDGAPESEAGSEAAPSDAGADVGCDADLANDPANCGRCARDCMGGGCEAGRCGPVAIAGGLEKPWYLAQDATHLYVTSSTTGHVYRVAKDGSGLPQKIVDRPDGRTFGVTVDDTFVYATDTELDAIFRVPKTGGTVEPLASVNAPIDVVLADGWLWFTSHQNVDGGPGRVERMRPGGEGREPFADPLVRCEGLAFDTDRVYVGGDDELKIYPKAGGSPLSVDVDPRRIEVVGGRAYVTDYEGKRVWRVSNVGTLEPLAEGAAIVAAGSFAVDDANVYWTTAGADGGAVYAASNHPASTAPARVMFVAATPVGIVLDERAIYVAANGAGTIVRIAR